MGRQISPTFECETDFTGSPDFCVKMAFNLNAIHEHMQVCLITESFTRKQLRSIVAISINIGKSSLQAFAQYRTASSQQCPSWKNCGDSQKVANFTRDEGGIRAFNVKKYALKSIVYWQRLTRAGQSSTSHGSPTAASGPDSGGCEFWSVYLVWSGFSRAMKVMYSPMTSSARVSPA